MAKPQMPIQRLDKDFTRKLTGKEVSEIHRRIDLTASHKIYRCECCRTVITRRFYIKNVGICGLCLIRDNIWPTPGDPEDEGDLKRSRSKSLPKTTRV
jgi:hypothetical protein